MDEATPHLHIDYIPVGHYKRGQDVQNGIAQALKEMGFGEGKHRGIPSAVINEHLVGDLVKFYGVAGTDFFYWFYPSNMHHSKFGLEVINGTAKGIPFDEAQLRLLCHKAAEVLSIHIYGGDCIVSEDGVMRIIDFNDWPSFAPCREEAAPNIARRIWDLMREHI